MRRALGPAAAVAVTAALCLPAAAGSPPLGPGIVRVLVDAPGGVPEIATGFEAAPGRIVTVAHVLDTGGSVSVATGGVARPAGVLRVDAGRDLAVLAVRGDIGAPRGAVGDGPRVLVVRGERTLARRAPVRRRIVAHVRGDHPGTRRALELGVRVAAGDSGAPLVDTRGRVMAVVFARSNEQPAITYAVDAAALRSLLP